jgi:CspA family cold shock protein
VSTDSTICSAKRSITRPSVYQGLAEAVGRVLEHYGFGFILASDGNEYFFHNSACADARFDDLREGQAVTFERGQGPKGPRGENVKIA